MNRLKECFFSRKARFSPKGYLDIYWFAMFKPTSLILGPELRWADEKYKYCYVLGLPPPICRPYRLCFYTYLSFCSQGGGFSRPRPEGVSSQGVSRPRPMGCIPACTEADPPPAVVYCCGRYASHWKCNLCIREKV